MKTTVLKQSWKYVVLSIICAIFLFPIIWIFLQSLKSYMDSIAIPPKFIFKPTLINYLKTLQHAGFIKAFADSLIIAVASVILCILIGAPFGYVLARYKFPGSSDIGFFILSTKMLPAIVIVIPFIRIFSFLKLIDTHLGLILCHIIVNLALVVWMSRGYFEGIPKEIEEAAWIDGCSPLKTFFLIVFPLAAPGIAATAVLAFLFSWNELFFGFTLTSFKVKTLPVYMASEFVDYLAVNWGGLSATGIIAIVPTLIFMLLAQKHIVRGLTFGAMK